MDNELVIKHFNKIAEKYDNYKKRNHRYYNALKNTLHELITKKNYTILDIGCGTGDVLNYLKPIYGLGIDSSKEMIRLAKQKYTNAKNLAFKTYDIQTKPYKGNFDYILLLDVIEHLSNIDKAINNISKIMTKKTTFVISMANPLWEPLLVILEKMHLKMPEGPHHRLSENSLVNTLHKNNLAIVEKRVALPTINLPALKNIGIIFLYKIVKST